MTTKTQILFRLAATTAACLLLAHAAQAQAPNADKPNTTRPAQTIKPAPKNKVGDSIQHGTDAAGRGISHADAAARSGINKGSEAASRPVRNLGDSIGRKLGLGTASSNQPAVGPQGTPP